MVGKRFLALAMAGLMVVTSVNTGSIKAYAQETDQESLVTSVEEAESALSEEGSDIIDSTAEEQTWGAEDVVPAGDESSEEELIDDTIEGEADAVEAEEAETTEGQTEEADVSVALTFNANGGLFENEEDTLVLNVKANNPLEMSVDAPVKEGYKFTGWFLDEALTEAVDLATYIFTENSVLFAGWQEIATEGEGEEAESKLMAEDHFTLDANGGTFAFGKTVAAISEITRYIDIDNYAVSNGKKAFTGWYKDEACQELMSEEDDLWTFKEDPESGKTYYAGWTDKTYKLTYIFGDVSTAPGASTGYYYQFGAPDTHIKEMTIYIPENAKIGSGYSPIYDSFRVRNEDLHYDFAGWFDSPERDNSIDIYDLVPTENMFFYAGFDERYVVTFHVDRNDGYFSYSNEYYDDYGKHDTYERHYKTTGSSYVAPGELYLLNPKNKVEGWYSDDETRVIDGNGGNIALTSDMHLYPKYTEDKDVKVLTFDLNLDKNPCAAFYDSYTGKTSTKPYEIAIDTEQEANYTPETIVTSDRHYRLLGFSTKRNATTPDPLWKYGDDRLDDEAKELFNPYYYLQVPYTEDTILYAVWEKRQGYIITLYSGDEGEFGYTESSDKKYYYYITDSYGRLQSYSNPEAYDKDKTFKGWKLNEEEIDAFNVTFTADTTLTATYAKAITVVIDANGGEVWDYLEDDYVDKKTEIVAEGNELSLNEKVRYDGNVFGGWFADEALTIPVSTYGFVPTKDCTVYAKWLSKYTVTFDYGSGKVSDPSAYVLSVNEGDTVVSSSNGNKLPKDPEAADESSAFEGWYDKDNNKLEKTEIENYVVSGNTIFHAEYAEAFKVTFNASNGFVNKTGTTYSVNVTKNESLKGKYPNAKSTDSQVFKGWADSTGKLVDNLYNYEVKADVTFTAQYTDCYVLTFHANQAGAVLEGGTDTVKVQVQKGTAYRFSSDSSSKDELFASPALDISGVTPGKVPLRIAGSDGSKVVGWATNENGTGNIYLFSPSKHYYIGEDGTTYGYGLYGFVPVSDMDFYAKWGEPVNVVFTSNEFKFRNNHTYDNYGELSDDLTKRVLQVPKGTTFGCISSIPVNAWDTSGSFSYRWSLDENGENGIQNSSKVNDEGDTYVYFYVYDRGEGSSTYSTIRYHSGQGYFNTPGNDTTSYSYRVSSTGRNSTPIPTIADSTKAFCGWFTDPECTTLYDEKYQFYTGGAWFVIFPEEVKDLYAGYADTCSVTLDANGGYFDDNISRTKDPDETQKERTLITVKSNPAGKGIRLSDYTKRIRRDGDKIFAGWYYANGTKAVTYNDNGGYECFVPENDVTLYAHWEDYQPVTSITLNTKNTTIEVGKTLQLKATVTPSSAKNQDVHWEVNGYSTATGNTYNIIPATITSDGLVTAQAPGRFYVYAQVNGVRSEDLIITIVNEIEKDSISIPDQFQKLDLIKNDTVTVKANVTPASKASEVVWKSNNPDIASVEPNGDTAVITAGGSEGETTITATLGKLSASINVKVSVSIRLDKNELTLTGRGGSTGTLVAEVAGAFENKDVLWTLSEGGDNLVTLIVDSVKPVRKVTVVPKAGITKYEDVSITATIDGEEYCDICTVHINPQSSAGPVRIEGFNGLEEGDETNLDGRVINGQKLYIVSDTRGDEITYRVDYFETNPAPVDPSTITKEYVDAKGKVYEAPYAVSGSESEKYVLVSAYAAPVMEGSRAVSAVEFRVLKLDQTNSWFDVDERDRALPVFNNDVKNVATSGFVVGVLPDDKVYTGEKITLYEDELRVYFNGRRLRLGTDYKVTYANNQNAKVVTDQESKTEAEINSNKYPKVTVTAAGSYQGKVVKCFSISPMPLTEKDDKGNDVVYYALSFTSGGLFTAVSSDKTIAPVPTIVQSLPSGKTVTLKNKTAFNVTYHRIEDGKVHFEENADIKSDIAAGKLLNYLINVEGTGNFTGKLANFTGVTEEDQAIASGAPRLQILSAEEVKQEGILQLGKLKVKKISVAYERNDDPEGTAKIASEKVKAMFTGEKPAITLKIGNKALTYVTDKEAKEGSDKIKGDGYYFTIDDPATDWNDDYINRYPGTDNYVIICPTRMEPTDPEEHAPRNLLRGEYKLCFTITGNAISIKNLPSSISYDGKTVAVYNADWSVNKTGTRTRLGYTIYEKINKADTAVKSDDCYDLYTTNDSDTPGTVTLVFTGVKEKGTTGKITKKVKVQAKKAVTGSISINFANGVNPEDVPYSKAGAKPAIVVRDTVLDRELIQDVDYTVTYSGNTKCTGGRKTAKVNVKFKGNYSGNINGTLLFAVGKAEFTNAVLYAESADKVSKEKVSKNYFMSVPALYDAGKKLTLKSEYTYVEGFEPSYCYGEDYVVEGKVIHAENEPITEPLSVVPAGALIRVSFRAQPTEKSNYKAVSAEGTDFTACYRMGQANISSFKITVPNQYYDDGREIVPSKASITATGKVNGTSVTLDSKEFEIVSVTNNYKVGTATMVIRGDGKRVCGTKKVTFKILKRTIKK